MIAKRILVVDDEEDLCEILLFNLKAAGFQGDVAYSAEEALQKIAKGQTYDLMLLDVMMPGMSGFELAEQIRGNAQTAHIPIIFLTAKNTEDDTLLGFGIGADDYVTKPFSVREVLARVKAVLKRSVHTPLQQEDCFRFEGLVIDDERKTVTMNDRNISLTKTEYELLRILLIHRGQIFTREQLLEQVWPKDVIVTNRTVDVNITRLRKKLGFYATHIVARHGYGYYFEPTSKS